MSFTFVLRNLDVPENGIYVISGCTLLAAVVRCWGNGASHSEVWTTDNGRRIVNVYRPNGQCLGTFHVIHKQQADACCVIVNVN